MIELPPHLQAGPSVSTAAPTADWPAVTAKRPFYKRKRYVVPTALLLLAMCGQDEDAAVGERPPAAQSVAPSPRPTFDRAQWLAANAATTKENARAVASAEAAQKAAAEAAAKAKAEAAAKVKAEAEAAARAEAARIDAEQAAAAEVARVAAEQAAAQEAARLEAARQAAEVQKPTSVYYENCTAVRAAGAAPIFAGDPGYRSALDRDGDGQGCGED